MKNAFASPKQSHGAFQDNIDPVLRGISSWTLEMFFVSWRAEIRITGSPGEKGREGTIISTHICRNLVQASWRVAQKGAESGGEKVDERPGIGGTANFSLGSPSIWKPGTGHTCRRLRYNRDLTFLIRLWITNVFNHLKVTTTLK